MERKKLSISAYMILCGETGKDSTKEKQLKTVRSGKFNKGAGYKVNEQQSVAFLYTNNEQSKKEIKKAIPFTIPSERVKY